MESRSGTMKFQVMFSLLHVWSATAMRIIVGSMKKSIYAIERTGGNVVWIFETGGEVWSASYNGKEIFIGSDDGFVYRLDIDGKLLWKTKLNGIIVMSIV
jgi:outer membrane protein assembly factor BamB